MHAQHRQARLQSSFFPATFDLTGGDAESLGATPGLRDVGAFDWVKTVLPGGMSRFDFDFVWVFRSDHVPSASLVGDKRDRY